VRAAVLSVPGEPPAYGEHPDPVPGPGETLVRVTAAPIVPLDLLCASGTSYFGEPAVPYVPGVQGVGVVERSAQCAPGSRVWFPTSAGMAPGDGGLAELCAVPDGDVVPLTAPVKDDEVAALGLSAVAAWMSLTWRARMQPGERVVVLGGGGAVGQVALGAARLLGAERIVAVCRSDAAAGRARRAGADEVVRLTEDVDAVAAALTAALDGTADVVIDPVFGVAATAASRVLGPGGRLVNLGGASGDLAELSSSVLRSRFVDVLGYTNNALTAQQRAEALTAVVEQAARGALAVDHTVLPLAEVAEGWRRTAQGSRRIVVVP
jgi:NADPH:quinone reductase-like Zn-dependent oxidoreductase